MESRQDVQQPPSSLTAVPAQNIHTQLHIKASPRPQSALHVKRRGVLRFGAGVGSNLLHHLAVGFILYQAVVTT